MSVFTVTETKTVAMVGTPGEAGTVHLTLANNDGILAVRILTANQAAELAVGLMAAVADRPGAGDVLLRHGVYVRTPDGGAR